ncbi:Heat repeat protein [Mycena indigotica]|uniref:Heat repeat protein n=1 Tax=Mycena indigotica TaxID=2126181 RepID=A0A8H6TDE5_9AGAR|nr:Heat repeat protein [Mycena indigotica]KAF7315244.1 Heat repeat protein [Mycena indigotica]
MASPNDLFQRLKLVCVPLMGASHLTPASVPNTLQLLTNLLDLLRDIKASGNALDEKLLGYTIYPIRVLLSRNESPEIPNQLLERIFSILAYLCDDLWWTCDLELWEQIFILCGSVIGGIEGKGKGKVREDETKEAAAQCLYSLLCLRDNATAGVQPKSSASRLAEIQEHASSERFIPLLGRTLDAALTTANSPHRNLKLVSLDLLLLLLETYFPDALVPTVLPGVVSSMTKLALGKSGNLGWAHGAVVARSLKVLQIVVIRSIGDDVCIRDGAVQPVKDLEDFLDLLNPSAPPEPSVPARPYFTSRTTSWLRGTATQLHIAFNTLTPLVSHTNPTALLALQELSSDVLLNTALTLPQTRPLLLSFLLSLSVSNAPGVSEASRSSLIQLLTNPSNARQPLLQTLVHSTKDNLTTLPRLLSSQSDSKVEHLAGIISATCILAMPFQNKPGIPSISAGLATLLGPSGGIEKWGWRLLSVLEVAPLSSIPSGTSTAQLMLENDDGSLDQVNFPQLTFRNLTTMSAHEALTQMFFNLGRAAGDSCLPAVEWFLNVGCNGTSSRAVSALWCACRLLEGVSGVPISTEMETEHPRQSKRLDKLARGVARTISELWDRPDDDLMEDLPQKPDEEDDSSSILHLKGVDRLADTLKITRSSNSSNIRHNPSQPTLHRILCLQMLAVVSGVLQARSAPLLLYTVYPVLHSLVSPNFHLSATALATLHFMARSASYASPSNLLLSNFDYALDAVARRLTRRWLDVDATKVLVILVRLVGSDVVDKASDVVEECFDRLDDFHGYEVVVEGLVEVLGEVIKVIEVQEAGKSIPRSNSPTFNPPNDVEQMRSFVEWFPRRHEEREPEPEPVEQPLESNKPEHVDEEPAATATQLLTKQIVTRSLYFLTHGSPVIRARILTLLAASVPVLPDSALLPSVHSAWPFILNRLSDSETYVVAATASLIDALVTYAGSFMYRRMWNDVWPRFRTILGKLDAADSTSALARRGWGSVGSESAYTHSHRLYRALLRSMTATMKGVRAQDGPVWQALLAFRRFLHRQTHEELQKCAREFYLAAVVNNADAVWLALSMTLSDSDEPSMLFLRQPKWEIAANVEYILQQK